jgi:sugar phosphate permease
MIRALVSERGPAPAQPTRTRWWVLFLISLLYLICYMDRGNVAVAQMEIARELGLSMTTMGLVLAVFTWAYAIGQVPAGWMGDRFGPKRVLIAIMTVTNVATVMTGAAIGRVSLFSARLLLGLGEAGAFPVASRAMQLWFAKSERGRIQGITHFFSRLAVVTTQFAAVAIMLAFDWRAVFYLFGSIGGLWSVAFYFFYRDRPEQHKGVNQAELAQIRGLNPDGSIKELAITKQAAPWGVIFGSPNMWYIALGYCCFFFGTNFYLTWYPTYMREYRHMSLQTLGIIGSLPLVAGMIGDIVGGSLTDLIHKRTGKAKLARRVVAAPGFFLAGVFLIPAATTTSAGISVLCLASSFFFLEWVIGPAWAVPMDVGGQFSGTVTGIMNMAGALAASVTSLVYGGLFDRGMWVTPFFVSAAVLFAGCLIWIFLIDPERSVIEAPAR